MLRERKAKLEARRRANMTPEQKVAAQEANTQRKRDRAAELKGRDGAGTKQIAEACGVTERTVRNWKVGGVLNARVKEKLGELAFSRLMEEIDDQPFFRISSRAYRDNQTRETKRKSSGKPGRASSPSRRPSVSVALTERRSLACNVVELGDHAGGVADEFGEPSAHPVLALRRKNGATH